VCVCVCVCVCVSVCVCVCVCVCVSVCLCRYTSLVKGHCASADLASARSTIAAMVERGVLPNVRTLNTFLRG
jgi:pentatricopeptide repeat protein